jgi:hypothetical protein
VVLVLFGWVGVLRGKWGIGGGIVCPVVLGALVKLGAVPGGSWSMAVVARVGGRNFAGAGVLDGCVFLGRGACC